MLENILGISALIIGVGQTILPTPLGIILLIMLYSRYKKWLKQDNYYYGKFISPLILGVIIAVIGSNWMPYVAFGLGCAIYSGVMVILVKFDELQHGLWEVQDYLTERRSNSTDSQSETENESKVV